MGTFQSGDYLSAFTKTESYFFTVLSPSCMPVCAYLHTNTPLPMSTHGGCQSRPPNIRLCYIIWMADSVGPDNAVVISPSVLLFPT